MPKKSLPFSSGTLDKEISDYLNASSPLEDQGPTGYSISGEDSKENNGTLSLKSSLLLGEFVSRLREKNEVPDKFPENPTVSVVIVNYNGVDFLWNCLFSLKTQTYPPLETILVDNRSDDASLSFVRSNYPQVRILECQENFGFVLAANLGAKCSKGDLVVFLNNDAMLTPDWIAKVVESAKNRWPKGGAVAGEVKPRQNQKKAIVYTEEVQTLNFLAEPMEGFFSDKKVFFHPNGSAMAYIRRLLPEGPFDPDYFIYQEDVFLGWKLRLNGFGVFQAEGARVFHEEGGTMSRFPGWKSDFYKIRNRWLNLLLLYEAGTLRKISPWLALDLLAQFIQGIIFSPQWLFSTLASFIWILTHFGLIAKKRKVIQERRKVTDEEILSMMSGRVARDRGIMSRMLNLGSLLYCRFMNIKVLESQEYI